MLFTILAIITVILIIFSIYQMNELVGKRKKGKLGYLFASPDDILIVFRFFVSMVKNKEPELRKRYMIVALLFLCGMSCFIGLLINVIKA